MIIEYTGRQVTVTDKYKMLAEDGLAQIEKLVGKGASAHVILTVDKYRKIAEVTVIQGSQILVAACESSEMMTALHDALAKVEQQAVRQRQKFTTSRRHPRMPVRPAVAGEAPMTQAAV